MKRLASGIVVLCLAVGPAIAQTAETLPPQESTANERLLKELQQITDEAERNRSASATLIGQLRDLARRYAWPWNRLIVSDSFDDGNYTQDPAWTVVSGVFTPAYGELISRHTAPATPQQTTQQEPSDIGTAIFGAVLQGLSQSQGQGAAPQAPAATAQIRLNAPIPNAFASVVTLRAQNLSSGGFEFGPGRDVDGGGYRVAIAPGTATLLRLSSVGSAIVDRANLPAGMDNGQNHTIELTRDPTGELVVSFDGSELMRVRDAGIRDPFTRFDFANHGGEYRMQSIAVYGTP